MSTALPARVPVMTASMAPEIAPFPELLAYATPPVEVVCRQGCHHYIARQVAVRNGSILFIDPRTGQLGIALVDPSGGIEARQYPFARTAVLVFLGEREGLDG